MQLKHKHPQNKELDGSAVLLDMILRWDLLALLDEEYRAAVTGLHKSEENKHHPFRQAPMHPLLCIVMHFRILVGLDTPPQRREKRKIR